MKSTETLTCKYNRQHQHYTMGNWIIRGRGGFCTVRTFQAENERTGQWFWQFKLKDVKHLIQEIEQDKSVLENLSTLYKHPLYSA